MQPKSQKLPCRPSATLVVQGGMTVAVKVDVAVDAAPFRRERGRGRAFGARSWARLRLRCVHVHPIRAAGACTST
jgi:hypothetical protein